MNQETQFSSKKEKLDYYKQEKLKRTQYSHKKSLFMKLSLIGLAILATGGIIFLAVREGSRPLIGEKFADLGQEHVQVGSPLIQYNSNPPTSGPHYAQTAPRGAHDEEIEDRYLIHNLEHGEVWISYNCNANKSSSGLVKAVYAHEGEEEPATTSATSSAAAKQNTPECKELVSKLKNIVNSSASKKMVLTLRAKNDSLIAIASWNWLLKLNEFDENKIKQFIKDHLNKGPEFVPDM